MIKLCCIFNYAPLYRKSIYKKIDENFDCQFYFSNMKSDIAKMDYNDFKRYPKTVRDIKIFGKYHWRRDILSLPFKNFTHYLVIGDFTLSYMPFLILCHLFGKKVYAWGHGSKSFSGNIGWYLKWFYKHCDLFFTYSEGGKQRLIDLGIPQDKLDVIYNSLNSGVNPQLQLSYKSNLLQEHFHNEYPTLLFIGRLTKVKRLDWIIKAQSNHKEKGINYNVLIIGTGPERETLQNLVSKEKLKDCVWFYGECYDDKELSTLLYNADLCVSPGNVGLTALHAMSYGTPVISNNDFETQMPEFETIIGGKTGLLYRKGDFEDFCDKIETWLKDSPDRNIVRENCYAVINDRFNSEYQINLLKSRIIV